MKNIPLRQYAGRWDNTVGQSSPKKMQEALDKLYQHLKNKGYPIDWDRLHLGGFSMGGRGVCRNGVARPEVGPIN